MGSASTTQLAAETRDDGAFVRQAYTIRDRITRDGSSGFGAEAGRYHLYVSLACPWAHRAVIVRRLLGLESVIGMTVVDPIRDERGWAFRDGPGYSKDPINDFAFLSEAYLRTDPDYAGRFTVPCIWDRVADRLVSNNYPDITIDFETQFVDFQGPGAPDLYPVALRDEIDELNRLVYRDVNNGVYQAGFATTQAAYEAAVGALFARLDWLEERLANRRFLVGEQLSEADIRLWTTLARFDAVYFGHFKCNLRRLVDYPNLWRFARDLWRMPGFGDTADFDHIKRHYYMTHDRLNPSRIVPLGPLVNWSDTAGLVDGGNILELRDAVPDDEPAVRELTLAAYGEYAAIMTPSAWAGLSAVVERTLDEPDPSAQRIVAVRDGEIVGSVRLYPPAVDAYGGLTGSVAWPEVRLLAVSPLTRGQGVGRALMAECVRRARASGATSLGLHTSASLKVAIGMYERMGFERDPAHDFQPPGAELVTAYRLRL